MVCGRGTFPGWKPGGSPFYAAGMAATLVLAEPGDGYVTEWWCDPPPWDARFVVLRDEWDTEHGYPVRRIYEFRLAVPAPA